MNKSYVAWMSTKQWCIDNPGKVAGIVTPTGTFMLSFRPKSEALIQATPDKTVFDKESD